MRSIRRFLPIRFSTRSVPSFSASCPCTIGNPLPEVIAVFRRMLFVEIHLPNICSLPGVAKRVVKALPRPCDGQ